MPGPQNLVIGREEPALAGPQHDWSSPPPGIAWRRPIPGTAPTPRSPRWGWPRVPAGILRWRLRRGGRVFARPASVASIDLDLAGLGQHVDDVGLEVGVVHAGLPELARVPVILPVVVPVAPAVGPKPVHVHLQGRAAQVTPRRGQWKTGRGGASGRGGGGERNRSDLTKAPEARS